jgi:hypothetical protein
MNTDASPELLEVVELPDGEIVLRRSDSTHGSGEPLVSIRFSGEARELLAGHAGNLGKSMIAAGLQMVGQMFRQQVDQSDSDDAADATAPGTSRKLH